MKIFILHNNETERLEYLKPKAELLASALSPFFRHCSVELIGDNEICDIPKLASTWWYLLRRANDSACVYAHSHRKKGLPNTTRKWIKLWSIKFWAMLQSGNRCFAKEQAVSAMHVTCWKRTAEGNEPAIILESDAVFPDDSIDKIVSITKWLQQQGEKGNSFYLDLAGGFNIRHILNAWCFRDELGCKRLQIEGMNGVKAYAISKLTTNTVCGYYLSKEVAAELYRWWITEKPVVVVDWALQIFSLRARFQDLLCIHFEPTVLLHGSCDGRYASGFAPSGNSPLGAASKG